VERNIQFVKEGEKKSPFQNRVPHSYLDGAVDWKLMVDQGCQTSPKIVKVFLKKLHLIKNAYFLPNSITDRY